MADVKIGTKLQRALLRERALQLELDAQVRLAELSQAEEVRLAVRAATLRAALRIARPYVANAHRYKQSVADLVVVDAALADGLSPLAVLAQAVLSQTPLPPLHPVDAEKCPSCGEDATDNWFDRTLCPEPCGSMHTCCANCGHALDGCPLELMPDRSIDDDSPEFYEGTLADGLEDEQ